MREKIKWMLRYPGLPFGLVSAVVMRKIFKRLSDRTYLKILYFLRMGKRLNLDNPQTYNEKLQWLKLHDRKPKYTAMVDKAAAKAYVAEIIGGQYVIPTIGVWDRFEDIDFTKLPDSFVLKCTHDSGGVVVCNDKSKFDVKAARKKLESRMKRNYYYHGREWWCKGVVPRIIAEENIDDTGAGLADYKFFCFNGEAKLMFVATERQSAGETKFDFYDMDFNHLPFVNGHPNSSRELKRPKNFGEMKSLAERLSVGIPQIRVDFYEAGGRTYFGEMTLSHYSGMVPFVPEEWDYTFGEWIELPLCETPIGDYGCRNSSLFSRK